MTDTPPTAKIISTHDATYRFPDMWVVQLSDSGRDPYLASYMRLDDANTCAKKASAGKIRARVFHLPSEAEAALAPLYEARDKAAVEYIESMGDVRRTQWGGAYRAAQQALDAARAAEKATP